MTPGVHLPLPRGYIHVQAIHVYDHNSQAISLVSQISGEGLQDHWYSGREIY